MVGSNDPRQVNRGKRYRALNWLDYSASIWDVDGIHSGSSCGHLKQPPLLAFKLILVVNWAAQYVVYGGPRFRRKLYTGRYSFNRRGSLSSSDRLPNVSPEVAFPD